MKSKIIIIMVITILISSVFILTTFSTNENIKQPSSVSYQYTPTYNEMKAVDYGLMVHNSYDHKAYYPSGENYSIMQKNLDYFNSEDCAHFVSEALIAGGLSYLAQIPPGDNLSHYLSGFNGSYGIVGVYRLADWLAGYPLPIFSTNSTIESLIGYQPLPASFIGSPHAAIFYVTNESILPSYIIWPGDVVIDGGAGDGHAMLYIGDGQVVQTDPAYLWNYTPGYDNNITTLLYISKPNGTLVPVNALSLNGQNVSSMYFHIPTFSKYYTKAVRITVLQGKFNVTGKIINFSKPVTFISSFPNGVGFGNYSYAWFINGKKVSDQQIFTTNLSKGYYKISVEVSGSNGTAHENYSIGSPAVTSSSNIFNNNVTLLILIIALIILASAIVLVGRRKKRK
jgi:hypothetical protein